MPIRCISFDLDDTFWDCASVIRSADQQLYAWLQEHQPTITAAYTPDTLIQHRVEYMNKFPALHYDLGLLRRNWLQQLAQDFSLDTTWVNPAFEYFLIARNQVEFFPEVIPALETLVEDKYQLGVITNGNAEIHRMPIAHLFSFAHSSAAAGVAKPDPLIFHQALQMAGVEAHEMVYVGDDPEKDIIGASNAGFRTIWFNPSGLQPHTTIKPDAVMTNFSELARLIQSLQ